MGHEMVITATKPLPVPLQKHSSGGCTTDMSLLNCLCRDISFSHVIPCSPQTSSLVYWLVEPDNRSQGQYNDVHLDVNLWRANDRQN